MESIKRKLLLLLAVVAAAASYALITHRPAEGAVAYGLQGALLVSVVYLIGVGANWMVNAAVRLAHALHVSPLMIGLTVVAFGTSAPELSASVLAAVQGNGEIAISNVIGSNIFNLCFILGGVAILNRNGVAIDRSLLLRDGPMVLVGALFMYLAIGSLPLTRTAWDTGPVVKPLDLHLEIGEGAVLFGILIAYLVFLYYQNRKGPKAELPPEVETGEPGSWRDVPAFLIGLTVVLVGCHVLVGHWNEATGTGYGALWFAHRLGLPDYIVGITIVAAGTSAPELVVSLAAAIRNQADMSIGNLLGSTVFNIFGVVGLVGLVSQPPLAGTVSISHDVAISLLVQVILLTFIVGMMLTGRRLTRIEGVLLVLIGCANWIVDFTALGIR